MNFLNICYIKTQENLFFWRLLYKGTFTRLVPLTLQLYYRNIIFPSLNTLFSICYSFGVLKTGKVLYSQINKYVVFSSAIIDQLCLLLLSISKVIVYSLNDIVFVFFLLLHTQKHIIILTYFISHFPLVLTSCFF